MVPQGCGSVVLKAQSARIGRRYVQMRNLGLRILRIPALGCVILHYSGTHTVKRAVSFYNAHL